MDKNMVRVGGSSWFCGIACEEVMRFTAFFKFTSYVVFRSAPESEKKKGVGAQLFHFVMIRLRRIICSSAC